MKITAGADCEMLIPNYESNLINSKIPLKSYQNWSRNFSFFSQKCIELTLTRIFFMEALLNVGGS